MTVAAWQDRKPVELPSPEQRLQIAQVPNSQFHAELIPDDELPIDCGSPALACSGLAMFWITSDSGLKRVPMCAACGYYAFAQWMCGI